MGLAAYSRPQVTDHGTLVALTADFDLNFLGSVAKVLMIAQVSAPIAPPGGDTPIAPPGGDTGPFTPSGDVLPDGGSDGTVPDPTPQGEVLGDRTLGGGGGGGPSGGGPGGGAPDAGGAGGEPAGGLDSGGGKLPFTGYLAASVAALGASFAGVGLALRAALHRRR